MKKGKILILMLAVAFGFVACEQAEKAAESTKEGVEETAKKVEETAKKAGEEMKEEVSAMSLDVPNFSSPELQEFAEEYSVYWKKVIDAQGNPSADGAALQKEAAKWTQKSQKALANMSAEDAQKWAKWIQNVSKKVQDAAGAAQQ